MNRLSDVRRGGTPTIGAGPTIAWRRLDVPGHDACSLRYYGDWWRLTGLAMFVTDQGRHRLEYQVTCDASWRTVAARVIGRAGRADVRLDITVGAGGEWTVNGVTAESVTGCIDVDLGFTPATNILAIRRLDLAVGEEASVRSAWLEDPATGLRPLDQSYRRVAHDRFAYLSQSPEYRGELTVNDAGFVIDYPGLWRAMDAPGPA